MGSVGDCYDNALCESFFATLACELLDRMSLSSYMEAQMEVFWFIEGWYNTRSESKWQKWSIFWRYQDRYSWYLAAIALAMLAVRGVLVYRLSQRQMKLYLEDRRR